MAKEVKIRGGTTVEHSFFTGAIREITVDTDKKIVVVHDGSTAGGFPLALESVAAAALPKAGGEMSGNITMAGAETVDGRDLSVDGIKLDGIESLATADQSDAEIKTAYENNADTNEFSDAEQSKLTGIEASADVTDDANVRAALAAATADISVNSHKITSVTDPTADQDAATKAYVDSIANGLATKDAVLVATTANITLSGLQTIDGVSLVANDRVLVKEQTNATENGIYDVAAGAWDRSSDANNLPGGELGPGTFTFVESGSTLADNGYVATGIATGTGVLAGYFELGTDNIVFSQFSGAGQITAGTNLNKDGNTINLDTTLTNFASTGIDDNASSTVITIDSGGDVGIGTASPNASLEIFGDSEAIRFTRSAGDRFGEIFYDGADYIIQLPTNDSIIFTTSGGTRLVRILASGNVGIGTDLPDGKLHVHSGSAGAVTAGSGVNQIVIESNGGAGMTILTPNNALGQIIFGDGDANSRGLIRYTHSLDFLSFGAGGNSNQVVINSSGEMGIGTTSPDGTLHVQTGSAGSVTANNEADDLIVEGGGATGISILSPSTSACSIYFGDPDDARVGRFEYDHGGTFTDMLSIFTAGTGRKVAIDSTGTLFVGDTANANMTIGLTINIGANDNQAFVLKSSDVNTNLTNSTTGAVEIDDFFTISKSSPAAGGVVIKALAEDSTGFAPFIMHSIGGQAGVTDTTTSIGLFNFFAAEHNNANALTNIISTSNLISFQAQQAGGAKTAFLLKASGELHLGNTTLKALDQYDDIAAVRALQISNTEGVGIVASEFDTPTYNYDSLKAMGVVGEKDENGEYLIRMQPYLNLHDGAIWQLHTRQKEMEVELNETRDALTQTTAALAQNTMVLEQAMKQLALLEGPNNG